MKKTVFITGASAGIGRACAKKYIEMGWNVVATMRSPEKEQELCQYDHVSILRLDVTDRDSIHMAVNMAIEKYGQIDVLINNAGYYSIGVLEAIEDAEIERQIQTNLIGLIQVTRAVLPYMREKKSGLIVNMSSVAGRTTVPLQSIYHASKWGVEGFTRSLQFEVEDMGIDVVLVEPGVIATDFYNRSMNFSEMEGLHEYKIISDAVSNYLIQGGNNGSSADEVAEKVYNISSRKKRKVQYPVGKSTGIIFLYKMVPWDLYKKMIKATMTK